MISTGIKEGDIRYGIDPRILIISSLEGALMISRLDRDRAALLAVQAHLERYLETEVRVRTKQSIRSSTTRGKRGARPASARLSERRQ
jgi:hypothetical protein